MVSAAELTIDIDVDLGSSIGQLEGLATALRDVATAQRLVDEDMNIDIDTTDVDDIGVTPTPDGGGGGGAVADGDGGDGFLDMKDVRRLRDAFGNAFDDSTFADMGGEATHPSQLLGGGLSGRHIDIDGLMKAIMGDDSDLDFDVLKGLNGDSMDDFMKSLNQVKEFTDLPTGDKGFLQSFLDMDIRMEQMHNALAKIMPLLLVFIGALPAAIAGMLAIGTAALTAAAAIAAIGGLGALGFAMSQEGGILENLEDVAMDIRDTFLETFGPLARQLAPMFEKGVGGLERFFSELAARGGTLLKFRDEAEQFGRFMIDFTATAIQRLGEFTQAAMPILSQLGEWIKATDFTNAFAQALRRSITQLIIFADMVVRALPAMIKFSQGFLNVAAVISVVFGLLWQLINIFPGLAEGLGTVVAALLALLTVTAVYSGILTIMNMELYALAAKAIPSALTGLYNLTVAKLAAAGASATLASALGLVVSLLTAGLGIAVALAAFEQLNKKISETTGNLRDFGKVSERMGGTSIGVAGGGSGGNTNVYNNEYNFDNADRDTRNSISKAEYTNRYFSKNVTGGT